MAAIPKNFGSGGANLACGGSAGQPTLADVLRDIAADLGDGAGAAITAPELPAFTSPPTAGEMAALRTLVNEIRAALVARSSGTLRTTAV